MKPGERAPVAAGARYVVTGAAGFVGAAVVEMILDRGAEVVGIDDLNAAYDPALKRWRLERLRRREGFQFLESDIRDREAIEACVRDVCPEAVLNLAARAGVRPSVADPWVYFETNLGGTLNLAEACRRHDVSTLLLASTSSLYGAHNARPFREDADTSRPLSPYAASKKAAEAVAATYVHLYGMNTPVPRYFTVYGPAGRPDMSVFRFIRWISEGQPLVLHGDGWQERDFTYVDDIARGTVAALGLRGFEVVNLGGGNAVTLLELVQRIEKLTGRTALISRSPRHAADADATAADVTKARTLLGWAPEVSLDEGLRRSVAWYDENRSWARHLAAGA